VKLFAGACVGAAPKGKSLIGAWAGGALYAKSLFAGACAGEAPYAKSFVGAGAWAGVPKPVKSGCGEPNPRVEGDACARGVIEVGAVLTLGGGTPP